MLYNTAMPINIDAEEAAFQTEVAAVKEWWRGSRWRYMNRLYTAEQIVTKRGNLEIQYPSNHQAQKLWKVLVEKFSICTWS